MPPALPPEPPPSAWELRLTLLDLPYNATGGPRAPSMTQSLDLAAGVDRLAVYGLRAAIWRLESPGLRYGLGFPALGALNALLAAGPLPWVHEEWHRAVLGSAGFDSRNGLYHPEVWMGGLIPVDQVRDEDLEALKAGDPANTVRLMSAGMEAQEALVHRLGDESFLSPAPGRWWGPLWSSESWMAMTMQVAEIQGFLYDRQCASPANDGLTEALNRAQPTVMERDFGGLDCTAWAYDLVRPDEPYSARGPHPTGEGIDRYRSWEDLGETERQLLRQQTALHAVNLLNPQLFFIDGFRLNGSPADRWMASLGQQATPFGWTLDGRFGLRRGGWSSIATVHVYVSGQRVSPGVELEVFDRPLWGPLSLDVGGAAWLQPQALRWDAAAVRPGGSLSARLEAELPRRMGVFIAADIKSAGWVAGHERLDPSLRGQAGLSLGFP